ncbi:hypothetical protein LK994_12300 [Ferruginibacter lapsinanis]|uniref:hypothetical protein n=1 Tax=Ferruginibacter lapsinanis TaxID=563172 RepID=UPI001E516A07|nr:hypothetical protein [Ferruginibacter lapsinanis]UEG49413.1 hypothetical protein LK994_12300 [Ferruginibacter lapsinanis]
MAFSKSTRINYINIGLMAISCIAAFIMPFEVFLFAYAVLGPLHYLTEISWLHDRKYFTRGKYNNVVLWIIGGLIILKNIANHFGLYLPYFSDFESKIIFVALTISLLMVFVQNPYIKIGGLFFILLVSNLIFKPDHRDGLAFLIVALLPTLIHVFIFTGFFMLYGALKERSKSGLLSVAIFIVCPILLFVLFRNEIFVPVTKYAQDTFTSDGGGFFRMIRRFLHELFGVQFTQMKDAAGNLSFSRNGSPVWDFNDSVNIVFHSQAGILFMRFIAFAYTYHYLNWFSKTEIIRWHEVPKTRFMAVIILWIVSLVLYAYNYSLGYTWLYFLSLCHVLLEFPLNVVSISGIGKELISISKNGFKLTRAVATEK